MKRILFVALLAVLTLGMGSCKKEQHDVVINWGITSYYGGSNDTINNACFALDSTFAATFAELGPVEQSMVHVTTADVDELVSTCTNLAQQADSKLSPSVLATLAGLYTMRYSVMLTPLGEETITVWSKDYGAAIPNE